MSKTLTLVLLAALSAVAVSEADAHGADESLFVAPNGVDSGQCNDTASPCQTIGYAMRWVGKGAQIRVAVGRYQINSAEELYHIIGGVIDVRGGFAAGEGFTRNPATVSTLIGVPETYRKTLSHQGFHIISDGKAIDRDLIERTESLLQTHETLQSSQPQAPCQDGKAELFDCSQVDLLAHVALPDVSSNPESGADVWGFVDLNTNREYALVGYNIGTAIFDVTDATNPREVAFFDGQDTAWRDIKIYQYWSPNAQRFEAYAYITSDGASEGLFVIDLGGLPQSARQLDYPQRSFAAAHNLLVTNTDFGTGLPLTRATPTLIIGGADVGAGRFLRYSLSSPQAPTLIERQTTATDGYMHDAASMIVTDERMSQCVNAVDYCEILFDFNVGTVDLWDISRTGEPRYLSSATYNEAEYIHSGWWTEDKQYLIVHDELDEIRRGDIDKTTVRVFSLADLLVPVAAGSWIGDTEEVDHNGYARGNRYYMSHYSRGLSILDITTPQSPVLAGYIDTYPGEAVNTIGAWGVFPFFHSGNIALSDINSGFYMLADRTREVAAGTLAFSSNAYGGDEGSTLQIAVQRMGGTSGDVSVGLDILAASASAADVVASSTTLFWADGDTGARSIDLSLVGDVDTDLERLLIRLVAPTGGATLANSNVASVYISEPGERSSVLFTTDAISVAETGFRTAIAVVQRTGSAVGSVSVDYALNDSTALAGVDFDGPTSGTLTWENGDADPKSIEFTISEDATAESSEFFQLALSNAVGVNAAIGARATLRVEIIDSNGVEAPSQNVPPAKNGGGAAGPAFLMILLVASLLASIAGSAQPGQRMRCARPKMKVAPQTRRS
jgi:choice-of-anchor B domain-containing protein